MTPADRNRLHQLLGALVEGTATDADMADLAGRLEGDAEARRFYLCYLDMHAHLAGAATLPAAAPRRRPPWAAVIVGGLLAASLLGVWLVPAAVDRGAAESPGPNQGEIVNAAEPVARAYVATVTAADADAVLNGERVIPGRRLANDRFDLSSGAIGIQFDGGARLLFKGESQFVIVSRREVVIERAAFVFEGGQTCESIEITTPHSVFKDIGTRYAAVIDGRGEEVHVADGAVRRSVGPAGDAGVELIAAGDGRRYEADAGAGAAIPLNAGLFARSPVPGPVARGGEPPTVFDAFQTSGEKRIDGIASGAGWRGGWVAHKSFKDLPLVSPGLAGPQSVAVLHDATAKPTASRRTAAHRRLAEPIDLSRDGLWYLRFLLRRGPAIGGDAHLGMVVLRTHGLTTQEEIARKSTIKLALQQEDGAVVMLADRVSRASLPQRPGETYAVVAKIVAGRVNPDQVFLRVVAADRLAGMPEPEDWSIASESIASDIVLDQVSLEFVSSGRIECGELCIGPTWESVAQPLGVSGIDTSFLEKSERKNP
jgi:hypothetical protein